MESKPKKAGRVASVSKQDLYDCLIKYQIFDSHKNLKKKSDSVWNDVLNDEKLKGRIEKQNLYLAVKTTRKGLLKSLKNYFFSKQVSEITEMKTNDDAKENSEIRDDGAIKNLVSLQLTVDYNNIIKEVCGNPMHILSIIPESIEVWKDLTNLRYLKEEPVIFIYSNKYVEKLLTFNHQSDEIIFYGLITHLEKCITPIFQVASEKKHKEFIDYTIREFLKIDGVSNPDDVVLPSNMSVIEGCLKALNSQTLTKYITTIIKYKDDFKKATNLPITCIHTDIMPILRFIEALDKTDEEKNFYAQFFCHISLISDLDVFWSEVQKLLVFAISESRNDYIDNTQAQLQRKFSTDKFICKLFNEYRSTKEIMNINDPFIDDFMIKSFSSLSAYEYIKEIANSAEALCTPYKKLITLSNPYRIQDDNDDHFINELMNFLSFFPIWTGVNFSGNSTINCFTQIKKSTEYFEAFDSFIINNKCVNKKTMGSAKTDSIIVDDKMNSVRDVSKMRVEDFIICSIEFCQNQLQNVCQRLESIPKNTKRVIKKKLRTKQTEIWKGKGEIDCNSMPGMDTFDFSVEEKNYDNESCFATTLQKVSTVQLIDDNDDYDVLDHCLDHSNFENMIDPINSSETLISSKRFHVDGGLSLAVNSIDPLVNVIESYDVRLSKNSSTSKRISGYETHTVNGDKIAKEHNYSLQSSSIEKASNNGESSLCNNRDSISFNESSLLNSTPIDDDNQNHLKKRCKQTSEKSVIQRSSGSSLSKKKLSNAQVPFTHQEDSGEPKSKRIKLQTSFTVKKRKKSKVSMNKKSSKFFSAFREVVDYYKRPRNRLYRSILLKSGRSRVFRCQKKKFVIESTSSVDSLIELLSRSVKNYPEFKAYCQKQVDDYNNQFLKVVLEHVQKNDLRSVHRSRCHLLYQHGQIYGHNLITCREEIDVFFKKLMEKSFSIMETLICEVCKSNEDTHYCTKKVYSKNFELIKLEDFIAQPENAHGICEKCYNILTVNQKFSNYVTIDLSRTDKLYDIEDIPKILNIDGNKFKLSGLIRLIPPIQRSKLNHYVAYVRNLPRGWKAYNNLSKKKKVSPVKCIRISLLLYVKVNAS